MGGSPGAPPSQCNHLSRTRQGVRCMSCKCQSMQFERQEKEENWGLLVTPSLKLLYFKKPILGIIQVFWGSLYLVYKLVSVKVLLLFV